MNNEELAYGLRSIAAPIHSNGGDVVAALNLAVHRTMASMDELIAHYGPAGSRTAREISVSMGHRLAPRMLMDDDQGEAFPTKGSGRA